MAWRVEVTDRGIIPAHAGFTPDPFASGCLGSDHPRTRGVYLNARPKAEKGRGSSPHTRGLPVNASKGLTRRGIIPAHAGFTGQSGRHRCPGQDHPRTRGVYSIMWITLAVGQGSSPHTRGLRPATRGADPESRIIPAHAGFTWRWDDGRQHAKDHPRTRGVYPQMVRGSKGLEGSSPHTRGLPGGSGA